MSTLPAASVLTRSDFLYVALVVFAVHALSLALLYTWQKLRSGVDKTLFTNYSVTVLLLIVGGIYREKLSELVTDPPTYVFLIPVVWYGFLLIYNLTKDNQEVQKMLTQAQIKELRLEIEDVDDKVTSVQEKLASVEEGSVKAQHNITEAKDSLHRMNTILESLDESEEPVA